MTYELRTRASGMCRADRGYRVFSVKDGVELEVTCGGGMESGEMEEVLRVEVRALAPSQYPPGDRVAVSGLTALLDQLLEDISSAREATGWNSTTLRDLLRSLRKATEIPGSFILKQLDSCSAVKVCTDVHLCESRTMYPALSGTQY